jgi:hypothetical protein
VPSPWKSNFFVSGENKLLDVCRIKMQMNGSNEFKQKTMAGCTLEKFRDPEQQ